MRIRIGRLALAAMATSLVATGCRTAKDIQRDYAKTLKPAQLTASVPAKAEASAPVEVRTLKLRVYADEDHRSQTLHWDERFKNQVERANEVLRPQFGVVLEVESFRPWPRHGGSDLQSAIDDLRALDPAKDVDWVVGLVSSVSVLSANLDQIGMGGMFSRHFVLRSMESIGEVQHLQQVLKDLPVAEREALFRERRLHKETAVLLHELGHTLGAFHERAWDWLMSPVYKDYQSTFSQDAARIIEVGLSHRDKAADAEGKAKWAAAWREVVSSFKSNPWTAEESESARAVVAQALEGTAPAHSQIELNGADVARYNEAWKLDQSGDHPGALKTLSPLVERYPGDARVQAFACGLERRKASASVEALRRCRAAMTASADPEDALVLGDTLLDAKDTPGALDALKVAEKSLEGKPASQKTWVWLASAYRRASSPSLAEAAAAHAPTMAEAASVLEWASSARRWAGLPPKAAIAADREHEIVELMDDARDDLRQRKAERAWARQRFLVSSWKQLPARHALACQLAADKRDMREVTRACTEALSSWGELVFPHFVLGLLHEQLKDFRGAEEHLQRTVQLDPSWKEGWVRLGGIYRARGRRAELASLSARYKERFGTPLPGDQSG